MDLKIKIKFYLLTKNYTKLKSLIIENEKAITYLEESKIEVLLDYAVKNQDFMLFNTILLDINKESSELKQDLADKYIKKYYHVFFNNLIFLYSIASMMSKDILRYKEEIEDIKKFILSEPLSEITIYLHTLNGFYTEIMEDKIFSSHNFHNIFCMLENASEDECLAIFKRRIKKMDDYENIYWFAHTLKNDFNIDMLKTVILESNLAVSKKAYYLLAVYKGARKNIHAHHLIKEIVLLNDYAVTNRLMKIISKEDVSDIINHYLLSNNKEIIFTLALTTDTKETISLIDNVLESNLDKLVYLIMFVKEKYLAYILSKVLNEEKACLNLINKLYIMGSNRWIDIIKYINDNNIDILSKEIKLKLDIFLKDKEEVLTRKICLT